jgi:hypothetical protein
MATSLKQVQASMNGDAKEAVQPIVESSLYGDNLTATPVLAERKYVVFKLVKKNVKRLTLDGICHNVLNPKNECKGNDKIDTGCIKYLDNGINGNAKG